MKQEQNRKTHTERSIILQITNIPLKKKSKALPHSSKPSVLLRGRAGARPEREGTSSINHILDPIGDPPLPFVPQLGPLDPVPNIGQIIAALVRRRQEPHEACLGRIPFVELLLAVGHADLGEEVALGVGFGYARCLHPVLGVTAGYRDLSVWDGRCGVQALGVPVGAGLAEYQAFDS